MQLTVLHDSGFNLNGIHGLASFLPDHSRTSLDIAPPPKPTPVDDNHSTPSASASGTPGRSAPAPSGLLRRAPVHPMLLAGSAAARESCGGSFLPGSFRTCCR